jgi:hypothetical protein
MDHKFLVSFSADGFLVAAIQPKPTGNHFMDTNDSHFSFLATCDPLVFANTLDWMVSRRHSNDSYWKSDCEEITNVSNPFKSVVFTRQCNTLSVCRGGCSVLYMGSVDVLSPLPNIIRKEYAKYQKKLEKSIQADMG